MIIRCIKYDQNDYHLASVDRIDRIDGQFIILQTLHIVASFTLYSRAKKFFILIPENSPATIFYWK